MKKMRRQKASTPRRGRVLPDDACPACGTKMVERRGTLRLPVDGKEIAVPSAAHLRCPKCDEVMLRFEDAKRLSEDAIERGKLLQKEQTSGRWMDVPEEVEADSSSEDLVRAWSFKDRQVFSVRVERWEDPAAWGILLADLARHVARSYAEAGLRTEDAALQRLIAGFRAEIPINDEG